MNIHKASSSYERWLATHLTIVPADLRMKHEAMRQAVFPFLRATFYRWAQIWPEVCPDEDNAPEVLAVGDLHIENFGTWRDAEGRLVWGINDFDEAARMPYTLDLVRLAASAHLAIDASHLTIQHRDACGRILAGYQECLEAGGRPLVLGERHGWLRKIAGPALRDPVAFWKKLEDLPEYAGAVPKDARRGMRRMLPDQDLRYKTSHRVAGLGSLGRERFVAVAEYSGAKICREAKALAPSSWFWARDRDENGIRYQEVLDSAVRALDPFVRLKGKWIVRRLAPDCSRVELASLPKEKQEQRLLHAMGWELANVHLGSKRSAAILKDLSRRPAHWLHRAAARMGKATIADWKDWAQADAAQPPRDSIKK
jgi:hypothetical protein